MDLAHRWIDRNLTRTELIMALLLLSVMIGFFSHHMYLVFGKVEKLMIDRTVLNINSALHLEASVAIMKRDGGSLQKLELINPMDLMKNSIGLEDFIDDQKGKNVSLAKNNIVIKPSNYGGIVIDDSDPNLEPGHWYFDQDDYLLFYILNYSEFFTSDLDGTPRIRYKVEMNFIDQDNDDVFDPSVDKLNSIQLNAIDEFEWSF